MSTHLDEAAALAKEISAMMNDAVAGGDTSHAIVVQLTALDALAVAILTATATVTGTDSEALLQKHTRHVRDGLKAIAKKDGEARMKKVRTREEDLIVMADGRQYWTDDNWQTAWALSRDGKRWKRVPDDCLDLVRFLAVSQGSWQGDAF